MLHAPGSERWNDRVMGSTGHAIDNVEHGLAALNDILVDFLKTTSALQPDRVRSEDGLSLSQGFMLIELGAHAGMSQRDLGDHLGLGKSTVSRLVSELESAGLVERSRNPSNHRFHQVCLTPDGRTMATRVGDAYFRSHAQLLMTLSASERQALGTGLEALVRAMRAHQRAVQLAESPAGHQTT